MSEKAKHTPGPWRVEDNGPHRNRPEITNYNIAYSEIGELVAEHVYEEADAHLIAAAPELLEVLETCVNELHFYRSDDMGLERTIVTGIIEEAEAIIAKAKGEG